MKRISIKEISEFFWNIEEKYNLINLEIDNFYVWQMARIHIFNKILMKLSNNLNLNISNDVSIKDFFSYIYHSIFSSPFLINKKYKTFLFEHKRKIIKNGGWVDAYSDLLPKNIVDPKDIVYISKRFRHKINRRNQKVYLLDLFVLISNMFVKINFKKIETELSNKIVRIEKDFYDKYKINIDLLKEIKYYYSMYKILYYLYLFLIKMKKPEKIIIVVNYDFYAPLIQVAKKYKIPLYEIQHGSIKKYHMGYSYPRVKKNTLLCFPDYIITNDILSIDLEYLPLTRERIILNSSKHNCIRNINKKKDDTICIVSQYSIGSEIADIVFNNIKHLSEYKIFYKIHPNELNKYTQYPSIKLLKKFSNIKFYDTNEMILSDIFSESKIVIGVYSTALFEAYNFGCDVYILNLYGWENVEKEINENKFKFIKDNNIYKRISK